MAFEWPKDETKLPRFKGTEKLGTGMNLPNRLIPYWVRGDRSLSRDYGLEAGNQLWQAPTYCTDTPWGEF